MRVINEERNPESKTVTASFLCCECGVCDLFACPIMLSPRRFYQEFKKNLGERGIKNPHADIPEKVDIYREHRRVPKDRLTRMLGLSKYEVKPEYFPLRWDVGSVNIPLKMHLGAPATATVKPGERVKKGDVIGEMPKGLGAIVHASISGTVESVNGYVRIVK
jgi:Na+-translocating ferredoxin:NAD+ oxidoreductase RnfC subunit